MSQIVGMAKRLQEAENTIAELKKALEEKTQSQSDKSTTPGSEYQSKAVLNNPDASGGRFLDVDDDRRGANFRRRRLSKESSSEVLLNDLSLDETGKVRCLTDQPTLSYLQICSG